MSHIDYVEGELVGPGFLMFFQHPIPSFGGGGSAGDGAAGAKFLPRQTEESIHEQILQEDELLLEVLLKLGKIL